MSSRAAVAQGEFSSGSLDVPVVWYRGREPRLVEPGPTIVPIAMFTLLCHSFPEIFG